jgi:murein DD-endopeptidase MepM/ murein hydrolase activator NlpD
MSRLRRFLVVGAVLAVVGAAAPATAEDVDDELERVGSRIDELSTQLERSTAERSGLATEILSTQERIDVLRVDLEAAREAADEAIRELNLGRLAHERARERLRRTKTALALTRRDLEAGRSDAVEWARQLYMTAGQASPESVLLSASSLTDAQVTLAYLDRVAEVTDAAVSRLEALEVQEVHQKESAEEQEAALTAQVDLLAVVEARATERRQEVEAKTAAVERELANQRALLGELDHEIDHFEGEIAALEKEQDRLKALLVEEQAVGGVSPAGFVRPVPGAITSPFGPRRHPILGYVRMHTGVDMTAPYGQAIRAAAGGRVILAGSYGGYGTTLIIDHGGGMATLYAHQSSLEVGYGAEVAGGDVIGYAGSTGLSTGPHLHFEVRLSGAPVNPAPYLAGT